MTDAERRAIYARMRADRLARRGLPVYDPERAWREVVATQALEGIVVRPEWRT